MTLSTALIMCFTKVQHFTNHPMESVTEVLPIKLKGKTIMRLARLLKQSNVMPEASLKNGGFKNFWKDSYC